MLRFLTDTAIPPTTNQAERDLRPAKTQQKISGRLRSEKTTRDRYAIRGYASAAAKQGPGRTARPGIWCRAGGRGACPGPEPAARPAVRGWAA